MKKVTFLLTALFISFSHSYAQDVIVLKDGNEVKSKIVEVGIENIKYKKWEYKDGPDFIISKSDIFMIKYQDGSKDMMKSSIETKKVSDYGRNILSFNPFNLAVGGNFSMAYEIMTKKGYVGFRIPAVFPVLVSSLNQYLGGLEIKIYPTKNQGAVRGYVGPSFLMVGAPSSKALAAGMVNAGISFQPSRKFNITVGGAGGAATEAVAYARTVTGVYKVDITLGVRF